MGGVVGHWWEPLGSAASAFAGQCAATWGPVVRCQAPPGGPGGLPTGLVTPSANLLGLDGRHLEGWRHGRRSWEDQVAPYQALLP
ncbi:hypothetical protein NDU88_001695 [Pleurodeles waltl]|uniref:Uncharacterized protein n=1 Tax=Pleurodeles waltl TaxID=8319 RepID=A0AAV7VC77_PLEWA|nr:hypothetical protein NDU88_001695 [Pleurodeles waltl]